MTPTVTEPITYRQTNTLNLFTTHCQHPWHWLILTLNVRGPWRGPTVYGRHFEVCSVFLIFWHSLRPLISRISLWTANLLGIECFLTLIMSCKTRRERDHNSSGSFITCRLHRLMFACCRNCADYHGAVRAPPARRAQTPCSLSSRSCSHWILYGCLYWMHTLNCQVLIV